MRRLLVGLLVITGCHKANQEDHSSPKEADALWALAPEGTKVGIVMTPRGLTMVEHGWQDLHAFVEKAPELAPIAKEMDEGLRKLTKGAADIRLADYGLTSDKGAAVFILGPERVVMVVPVADRDKFLAMAHGQKGSDADTIKDATCKAIKNVYACTSEPALLDRLGKGAALRDKLEARGDIEIVGEGVPGMPMKSGAGAVQLERGQIVVRGTLVGLPADVLAQFGAPIKPELDREHSAGFAVGNLAPSLAQIPDAPIGAGVSTGQLAKSLVGPVTMSVPAGQVAADIKIPLNDPAPATTLVGHCTELLPPTLGATAQAGACHIPVPMVNLAVDAWVDGKTLHIGMKGAPQGKTVALTRLGSEIADGSWSLAVWGRGTALAAPALPVPAEAQQDPQFLLGIRAMMMLNEMGVGVRVDGDKLSIVGVVRTAWSNPDDVVAKLATFPTADLLAGKGPAFAQSLGKSPLATDAQAGYVGLLAPGAMVGLVAASAIRGFVEYQMKSQSLDMPRDLDDPPPPPPEDVDEPAPSGPKRGG